MTAMNEQFWLDVIEAYRQVNVQHDRYMHIERDSNKASVFYDNDSELIVIEIESANTQTREARIVPA